MIHQQPNRPELRGRLFGIRVAQRVSTLVASDAGGSVVRTTSSAPVRACLGHGIVNLPAGFALDVLLVHIVDYTATMISVRVVRYHFRVLAPHRICLSGTEEQRAIAMTR